MKFIRTEIIFVSHFPRLHCCFKISAKKRLICEKSKRIWLIFRTGREFRQTDGAQETSPSLEVSIIIGIFAGITDSNALTPH